MASLSPRVDRQLREAHARLDAKQAQHDFFLLWAALLVAALGIWLAEEGGYHAGFHTLNGCLGGLLPGWFWQGVTRLGDERLIFALALFAARHRPEVFWSLFVAGIIGICYSRGLKPLIDAARPPAVLPADSFILIGPGHKGHAFPSGHTLSAFLFFSVLAAYTRQLHNKHRWLLLALLAGWSRVALGVHWPHDALAGAFGGMLAAWAGIWLATRWRWGLKPAVFKKLLLLPILGAVLLLFQDGGYPESVWLTWPVAVIVLALAWESYGPAGSLRE